LSAPHGILVVDKPSGPTSHDVVARARRLWGTRSVGHAGTLDPLATGVLVLMFGEACKLSQYLTAADKAYLAEVRFGRSTDTLDAAGLDVEIRKLATGWLDRSAFALALDAERARTEQIPPMVSAIQVGGERAHRAARRGAPLELAPRAVRVSLLQATELDEERASLELRVSKGYYVRALARDLGAALGVPAHLAGLRRTASGRFTLADATAWPPVEPVPLLPLADAARRALPQATLSERGVARARRGQRLEQDDFERAPEADDAGAWFGESGELVAIGAGNAADGYRVVRGFTAEASAPDSEPSQPSHR
jgi:tRNA pseudouridine55 synthase